MPGETTINGKVIATLFARVGARVLCVDRDLDRAQETVYEISRECASSSSFNVRAFVMSECSGSMACSTLEPPIWQSGVVRNS